MFSDFHGHWDGKKTLSRLLGIEPGKLDEELKRARENLALKPASVEFIITLVCGEPPTQLTERISQVLDLADAQGAVVTNINGPMSVMAFGLHMRTPITGGTRLSLVAELRRQLASGVKIVHGKAEGFEGAIGNSRRLSYGILLPRFDEIIGALSRLEFGQEREFNP